MQTASEGRLTTHVYVYVFIGLYQFNSFVDVGGDVDGGGAASGETMGRARPFTTVSRWLCNNRTHSFSSIAFSV